MWFEKLTGFTEESPQQVRKNITMDEDVMESHVNGKAKICGVLETPSLADLRQLVCSSKLQDGKISVREVVADTQHLRTNEWVQTAKVGSSLKIWRTCQYGLTASPFSLEQSG